ncbi:fungal hydrophobin [Dentipellis sp. KUC8613]|nr:fungal hydrophobin [Dentipellis sp. KUC8613]
MFSKLFFLTALAAAAATASATPAKRNEPASECSTAPVQCCDSVQSASSPAAASLLASLGVVLQDLTTPIGITCSPISVVGVGSGATCSASPVCCDNNNFNGVVALGCVPVDLNL